eukprot:g1890.t1
MVNINPLNHHVHCVLALAFLAASSPLGRTTTLRGGVKMPTIGLGSSGSCGPDSFGTADNSPCAGYNATMEWFKNGGRAVHDALSYCNQYGVGRAVRDSGLPREEVFVMSMVPKFLMGYNETKAAVRASLQQMGLAYLDLVMVHHRAADFTDWPRQVCKMKAFPAVPTTADGSKAVWAPPPCAGRDPTWRECQDETWRALGELKNAGLVRAIGVSNWPLASLRRMQQLGQELPAVNQVEAHVGYHEDDLIQFCNANGIFVQAATPLARSLPALIEPGGDPVVTAVAQRHGKFPSQIALRYLLEIGVGAIPSTANSTYQQQNLDLFDFALSKDEVRDLSKVVAPCRGSAALGLSKCWADPSTMMCMDADGRTFHCP